MMLIERSETDRKVEKDADRLEADRKVEKDADREIRSRQKSGE